MDKKVIITSDWETCYLVKYRHEYEKKWVECRKDESIFSGEYFEVIEEAMKKNYVIYYPYEPFKQMYPDIVFNVTKESGIHYLRIAADRASWKSTIEYHNNQKIYIIQWEESENSYILGYWVKDKKTKHMLIHTNMKKMYNESCSS